MSVTVHFNQSNGFLCVIGWCLDQSNGFGTLEQYDWFVCCHILVKIGNSAPQCEGWNGNNGGHQVFSHLTSERNVGVVVSNRLMFEKINKVNKK